MREEQAKKKLIQGVLKLSERELMPVKQFPVTTWQDELKKLAQRIDEINANAKCNYLNY